MNLKHPSVFTYNPRAQQVAHGNEKKAIQDFMVVASNLPVRSRLLKLPFFRGFGAAVSKCLYAASMLPWNLARMWSPPSVRCRTTKELLPPSTRPRFRYWSIDLRLSTPVVLADLNTAAVSAILSIGRFRRYQEDPCRTCARSWPPPAASASR